MFSTLSEKLADRIGREGAISFRDFMEAALYDPDLGYYSRGGRIGSGGDFVTSPSLSPLFARAVARAFAADAAAMPGKLAFLELASGDGRFLTDLRTALNELAPDVAERVRILSVERSEIGRRAIEARRVANAVSSSLASLETERLEGWIFSNELFDALPVHRVVRRDAGLSELCVDFREGRFCEIERPAAEQLSRYFDSFEIAIAPGQKAEVNLEARPLYTRMAALLARGRIVTLDYGHRARTLYHSHARFAGTLAVHSSGRRGNDPFARPGEVDMTAHVNWDDLIGAGAQAGLSTDGLMRQWEFLTRAGIFEDAGDRTLEAMRLIDPEGIGEDLSVLLQRRDMPAPRFALQLTSRL